MRKKGNRTNSIPQQNTNWQELLERKEEFLRIIEILNRYYSINPPDNYPSESHKFREKLLKTPTENFKVFIKQFGGFEYFIAVELATKEGTRFDSWIHIDGIEQERKELELTGQNDHPVFQITSMTDLFKKHCKELTTNADEVEMILKR